MESVVKVYRIGVELPIRTYRGNYDVDSDGTGFIIVDMDTDESVYAGSFNVVGFTAELVTAAGEETGAEGNDE